MSWLTSWIWRHNFPHTRSHRSPDMTRRLIPGMSGLFDTGATSETGLPLSLVKTTGQTLDDLTTLNASDIFAALEGGGELPNLDDESLGLEGSGNFYEGFTDLSEFLFSGNEADVAMDMEDGINARLPVVKEQEGDKPVMRSAYTAVECSDLPPPNPDHDDYISKAKRPRLSTVKESSTSDVTQPEKDSKYVERRRKNNIASRRSRETRKQKFSAMETQADDLEKANCELRKKVEELEQLTKLMKETLIKRMVHGK